MSESVQDHWNRAQRHLSAGQIAAARAQYDALSTSAPAHIRTLLLATQIAWSEDRVRDACRHALYAAQTAQRDAEALGDAIRALIEVGEEREAYLALTKSVRVPDASHRTLWSAALSLQQLGRHSESLDILERIRASGADDPARHFYLGQELLFNGHHTEAEAELRRAVQVVPAFGIAMLALVRLRKQTAGDNHLALIDRGLAQAGKGTRDRAALDFARYYTLENLGRHDEAWAALMRGNAGMRERNPHDAAAQTLYLDRCIATIGSQTASVNPEARNGPQPIFILGLPRSGTTVLERMLGNHPEVVSAGELTTLGHAFQWATGARDIQSGAFLERLHDLDLSQVGKRYLAQSQWRAEDRPFFIDKQPPNWWLAGLIPAALPKARILHMVREPMDVCFSNFRAFCGDDYGYCYDLSSIASTWHDHYRLMAHWHSISAGKILDVRYDQLVQAPERTLRRVLDFCGLPWESDCIDLGRNRTPVATLSTTQVRAGLHMRGAEEWAPYASQLEPLRRMLQSRQPSTALA